MYRLYRLDDAGRIRGVLDEHDFRDDDHAVARAAAEAERCGAVEVWCLSRKVRTLRSGSSPVGPDERTR